MGCVQQGVYLVRDISTGCAANAGGRKQAMFFQDHLVRHGDDRRDKCAGADIGTTLHYAAPLASRSSFFCFL